MTLFRDEAAFRETIRAAGEQLRVNADILEKDYWVTQVLRTLADQFLGQFVFKGGTSLSKCYGIIDRFSEDVDLLVLATPQTSKAQRHALMKRMGEGTGKALGLTCTPTTDSETGVHKSFWLDYGTSDRQLRHGVKLEMSTRGPAEPSEAMPVEPMIAPLLAQTGSAYTDLESFEIQVQHPGRTLIEKLCVIHTDLRDDPVPQERYKLFRHYYDVYQLLDDKRVLALLADAAQVREIERRMHEVVEENPSLRGDPRPDGGWATSPAFNPEGKHRGRIYHSTMTNLSIGRTEWPSYREVCHKVRQCEHLL